MRIVTGSYICARERRLDCRKITRCAMHLPRLFYIYPLKSCIDGQGVVGNHTIGNYIYRKVDRTMVTLAFEWKCVARALVKPAVMVE
jgi:hypothetical protein